MIQLYYLWKCFVYVVINTNLKANVFHITYAFREGRQYDTPACVVSVLYTYTA